MINRKLERKSQTIFADLCPDEQMCAFGTPNAQVSPEPIYSKDVEEIQTSVYENGWFPETLSGNIRPYAEDMNGLHYVHSYQLAYLLQQGIPEWNKDTPYFQNCICRVGSDLYIAKKIYSEDPTPIQGMATYPPNDPTDWNKFTTGVDDFMPVGASLEWNSNVLPSDKWLFEQGQLVSAKLYPKLYEVLEDNFGQGEDRIEDDETVHYFRLPNSVGKFTVSYKSGNDPRGRLGSTGGSWDMVFTIPPHKHGIGDMKIVASGGHTHGVEDSGHYHNIVLPDLRHQHTFRFGDYTAGGPISGQEVVRRLVTLGSTGSGTDANPTQVGWNAGTPNGNGTGHFMKMVSPPTPLGSNEPFGSWPPNQNLNSGTSQTNLRLKSSDHIHDSSSFVGMFGASESDNNGDTGFQTSSNNPPYIVKRKIIRVLP